MTALADAAARLAERVAALLSRRAEHGSAG
jgi:hypothetical protein